MSVFARTLESDFSDWIVKPIPERSFWGASRAKLRLPLSETEISSNLCTVAIYKLEATSVIESVQTQTKNLYDALLISVEQQHFVQPLRASGLSVLGTSDLVAAEAMLSEGCFGVILLDLGVSGATEVKFSEWRRLGNSLAQILLLCQPAQSMAAIEGIVQGADGQLPLPLSFEALALQVNYSLARFRDRSLESRKSNEIESLVLHQTLELQQIHVEIMKLLSVASCYRDHETGTHNQRVGLVSGLLAKAVGWSDMEVEDLRLAALMHDIGKLAIPDVILRKPGKLTPQEYRLMQRHTIFGDEILAASKLPVLALSRQIALSHHERWDGGGYPHQLRGVRIPQAARIVAIADVYDALTHDRIYREALPESEAMSIMGEGRATHFDPELLDAFFEIRNEVDQVNATILEDPVENSHKLAIWEELVC